MTVVAPEEPGYRHTTTITATSLAAGSAAVQDLVIVAFEAGVEIGPSRQGSGLPGSAITYTHTITNLGNGYDRFTLTVAESLPPSWTVTLSPDEIGLEAGASAAFTVTVGIPAGAAPGDTHTAHIAAHSTADLAISDDLTDTTTVGTTPQPEYGLLLLPASQAQTVSPGETAVYTHTLTNSGNVADTVNLSADTDTGWPTILLPQQVTLAAGESASVVVEVQAPPAPPASATTTVTALSGGDSSVTATASDVTTVQAPPAEYAVVISPTSCTNARRDRYLPAHDHQSGPVADSFVVTRSSIPPGAVVAGRSAGPEPGASTGSPSASPSSCSRRNGGDNHRRGPVAGRPRRQRAGGQQPDGRRRPTDRVAACPSSAWPGPVRPRLHRQPDAHLGQPDANGDAHAYPSPTPCTPTGIDLVVTDIAVQPLRRAPGNRLWST